MRRFATSSGSIPAVFYNGNRLQVIRARILLKN